MKTSARLNSAPAERHPARKLAAAALLGLSLAATASASVSFVASGVNKETGDAGQSAEADVSLVGNTLTLTLANTTGVTRSQGDALTGILFNLARNVSLELESVALTSGSHLWTSGSAYNDGKTLWGSWTDKLADHPRIPASYGLATTGFNGEFVGGDIEIGNASPDYGVIGAGTLPGSISGARYPFVQNGLTFTMKVESGSLSESDITGVGFLFGTSGQGWIQGSLVPVSDGNPGGGGQAPEPAPILLLGTAVAAARMVRRSR